MFKYMHKVQYYETDKMGIVHHSNYIRFFEEARTEFMSAKGINYADMEARGIMLPVVEVSCRYRTGAKYGEVIAVETCAEKCGGITLKFNYVIKSTQRDCVCAEGSSLHCFVNSDFKPIKLQKYAPDVYEKICSAFCI